MHSRFNDIPSKDEFQSLVQAYWVQLGETEKISLDNFRRICFELWCSFYSHSDISVAKQRNAAEEQTRNLIKFTDSDQFAGPWERGIYRTIANLVIGKRTKLNLSIETFEEFEHLLKSWQSTGVQINPRKVVDMLAKKTEEGGHAGDLDVMERYANIVGPYTSNHKMFGDYYNHSQKFWLSKLSRTEIKEKIIERAQRARIPVDGRLARDYQLALLFKKYYEAECVTCGAKGHKAQIEVSHKIPLSLGVDNFALDSPINMELLCHTCHKRYEAKFDKDYKKSKDPSKFLERKHKSQLRNSPWSKFIDLGTPQKKKAPRIDYSGKLKCINCRRQYKGVELCKKCGGAVRPIEDPLFKNWKK